MRLFRAELARLFARRFTRIGLVGLVLLLGIIAASLAVANHRPSPADITSAQIQADQALTQMNAEYQSCLDAQQPGAPPTPDSPRFPPGFDCRQIVQHPPTEADFLPASFNFAVSAPDLFRALGVMLALFGFAVGASFIGAEWNSGGVTNLLLWRPTRIPVWLGKLAGLLAGTLGVGVALSLVWYGTLWLIADHRGTAAMTPGGLRSLALTDARALTLALVATVLGYAISALGRNTATALGVAVAWVVLFEIGLRIILGLLDVARPEHWFLSTYVAAWLTKTEHFVDHSMCDGNMTCKPIEWSVSWSQSAVVGGILVAVVVATSLYAFRRRDVA
jgi:ABC-2 type transport system permease protein